MSSSPSTINDPPHPYRLVLDGVEGATVYMMRHNVTIMKKEFGMALIRRHFKDGEAPAYNSPRYEIIGEERSLSQGLIDTDEKALIFFAEHVAAIRKRWDSILASRSKDTYIVNGTWYTDGGATRQRTRGSAGSLRIIQSLENPQIIVKTNNLWLRGKIPDELLPQAPDTARFLSKKQLAGPGHFICPKCLRELQSDEDFAMGVHRECPG